MTKTNRPRIDALLPSAQPRRYHPPCGQSLTVDSIRGDWRPSGAVAGLGVFAVIWSTRSADFWAPLHDFSPPDQLRLIEACRSLDMAANGAGNHVMEGR